MVSFLQTIKLTTAILNQKLRSVYKKSPIGYKWQGHIVFLAAFIVQGFNFKYFAFRLQKNTIKLNNILKNRITFYCVYFLI